MTKNTSARKYLRGDELAPEQQREALARFVHRYTREHKPNWARLPRNDVPQMPVHFASDAEWLENTFFPVNADGRLSNRSEGCQSAPTWPDNPELRTN